MRVKSILTITIFVNNKIIMNKKVSQLVVTLFAFHNNIWYKIYILIQELPMDIIGFKKEYKFLDNSYSGASHGPFVHRVFLYDGSSFSDIFRTAEHAYQCSKAKTSYDAHSISRLPYADQVYRNGRKLDLRPDWEDIKLDIMGGILRSKFSTLDLDTGSSKSMAYKLLATGDQNLINETKFKRNLFWGTYDGVGENHLGKLLMEIREELKKHTPQAHPKTGPYKIELD